VVKWEVKCEVSNMPVPQGAKLSNRCGADKFVKKYEKELAALS